MIYLSIILIPQYLEFSHYEFDNIVAVVGEYEDVLRIYVLEGVEEVLRRGVLRLAAFNDTVYAKLGEELVYTRSEADCNARILYTLLCLGGGDDGGLVAKCARCAFGGLGLCSLSNI